MSDNQRRGRNGMKAIAAFAAAGAIGAGGAFAVDQCETNCGLSLALLRDRDQREMKLAGPSLKPAQAGARTERPALREEPTKAFFVRGGYTAFASGGGLADGKGANLYSGGYRSRISQQWPLSLEAEVAFQRDKDTVIIGLGQEVATRRAISGLVSMRYDGPRFGRFTPYFSGGMGPAQVKTRLDDGVTPLENSNIELAYQARVGVAYPLTKKFALEAGYRLLGATNDDIKTHTAEIGLNYRF
ncbi:MAG: porin family protein [Parvularculaceae bacterium]